MPDKSQRFVTRLSTARFNRHRAKSSWFVATSFVSLLATGCGGPLYTVSADPSGGIPFLRMEPVRLTTITYAQPWWSLELTVIREFSPPAGKGAEQNKGGGKANGDAKNKGTRFKTTLKAYATRESDAIKELITFNSAKSPLQAWTAVKMDFEKDSPPLTIAPPIPLTIPPVASATTACPGVDLIGVDHKDIQVTSDTLYFANVDRPTLGTASATITLNPNGTLGSAQAQSQSNVDSILSAVAGAAATLGTPLVTSLSGRFIYDSATAAAEVAAQAPPAPPGPGNKRVKVVPPKPPVPPPIVDISLVASPFRRLYTISILSPRTAPLALCPSGGIAVSYSQRVEALSKADTTDGPKDGITFSGQVALPKSKTADDGSSPPGDK